MNTIPVSASNWVPLSASYEHDTSIVFDTSYLTWVDGYTSFSQSAFKRVRDVAANYETLMYLPSSHSLFDFIEDTPLDQLDFGAFVYFSIDTNGLFSPSRQYISTDGETVMLSAGPSVNSFFRMIVNSDNSFSLFYGEGLYVTVSDNAPFCLTLEEPLAEDELDRQKFYWFTPDDVNIYITTNTLNRSGIGPAREQRFLSYLKAGPDRGQICANGVVSLNDYLFTVEDFVISYIPQGLTQDHTWVRYYNTFPNSRTNKTVDVNLTKCVYSVPINHFFTTPYKSKISVDEKNMKVNFANLKSIMTDGYEYRIK